MSFQSLIPRLLSALGMLAGLASVASAQTAGTGGGSMSTGGVQAQLLRIGGERFEQLGEAFVGVSECENNAPLVFELDGVPSNKQSIDVYVGDSCQQTDRRSVDANRCRFLTTQSTDNRTMDIEVELDASDLFSECRSNSRGSPILWFLPVETPESSEAVEAYATYRITVDADPPDAPTNVTGGTGENQIPVGWDTSATDLEGFIVFVDSEATSGPSDAVDGGAPGTGECGSSRLVAGADPASVPSGVRQVRINEPTATGTELRPSHLNGDRAAVAVVAIDLAGNPSPLSNTGCVRIVPTESFWDRYQAEQGDGAEGCPCSAVSVAHLHGAWPIALALLVLRRGVRRRRS